MPHAFPFFRWSKHRAVALTLGAGALLTVQAQTASPAPAPAPPTTTRPAATNQPGTAGQAREKTAPGQAVASARAGEGERNAVKWFNMLDANGDGRVSLDEAQWTFVLRPSLRAEFDAADTNHDGLVTAEEVRAAAQRRRVAREARRARERAAQAANLGDARGKPAR